MLKPPGIMIFTRWGFGVLSFVLQNVLISNSKNLSWKQNVKKETNKPWH
jgi:hypothetical protein